MHGHLLNSAISHMHDDACPASEQHKLRTLGLSEGIWNESSCSMRWKGNKAQALHFNTSKAIDAHWSTPCSGAASEVAAA